MARRKCLYLQRLPDRFISVKVKPKGSVEWILVSASIDANVVYLDPPPKGSTVEVQYVCGPEGSPVKTVKREVFQV